ncbi:MAG: bacteriohemerythrin [Thermoguttaceae bacterium]|jgi:hemerythrin
MIPYIPWQDYYSVGEPSLDAQHRQIIGLINELYEAMQQGKDREAAAGILDRLVEYTRTHFDHEEQLMRDNAYPDVARHVLLHADLRRRTADCREQVGLVAGRDLLHFLKQWWLDHIQGADKRYAPFLEPAAARR